MSDTPFNDIFKKQQKKLVPATFKKGFVSAINVSQNTVDVFFAENPQNVIRNVPLASNIIPSLIMKGDRCRIDVFDETNPNDMVVAYIYGRSMPYPTKTLFLTGTFHINPGDTFPKTITHNAGFLADVYFVVPESSWLYSVDGKYYDIYIQAGTLTTTQFQVQNQVSPAIINQDARYFLFKFG